MVSRKSCLSRDVAAVVFAGTVSVLAVSVAVAQVQEPVDLLLESREQLEPSAAETTLDGGGLRPRDGAATIRRLGPDRYEEAVPLSRFRAFPGPLLMTTASFTEDVFFPLSSRVDVIEASLDLDFANSIALLPERSVLWTSLNGPVFGQIRLRPETWSNFVRIDMPERRLSPGFNELGFHVAQHYADNCEDYGAPELWTEIDTAESAVRVIYDQVDLSLLPVTLADLPDLFSTAIGGSQSLQIMTVGDLGDAEIRWGSKIARAAGLMLGFVVPEITYARARQAPRSVITAALAEDYRFPGLDQSAMVNRDSALVGTRSQLESFMRPDLLAQITGPYIGIHPLDANATEFVLVISGRDAAEVDTAADVLMYMDFPMTDRPFTVIQDFQPPVEPIAAGTINVARSSVYQFSDLGFSSTTIQGMATQEMFLEVIMPPDMFAPEDVEVVLLLNLAFGAGLRDDSVLNILVNGQYYDTISLNVVEGAVFREFRLPIPLRRFRPGLNRIAFESIMVPLRTGECLLQQDRNLQLSLFENSELHMPDAAEFAVQPDLSLFIQSAFPHFNPLYGTDASLLVTGNDPATAVAAWTFAAKLAQVTRVPMSDLQVGLTVPTDDRHVMVVGPAAEVPEGFRAAAPVAIGDVLEVPYPSLRRVERDVNRWQDTPLARTFLDFFGIVEADLPRVGPVVETGRLTQRNPLGDNGLMMSFRAEAGSTRTVTLITARDPALLRERVRQIVEPAYWFQSDGDLVVWNDRVNTVGYQEVAERYYIGTLTLGDRLTYITGTRPVTTIVLLLGGIVLFAVLFWYLLQRRAGRRQPHG